MEGDNLGILIGRRGETMDSLSYLTGLVANRLGGDYQKVALDVAGYRSKRESDLVALAKLRLAKARALQEEKFRKMEEESRAAAEAAKAAKENAQPEADK